MVDSIRQPIRGMGSMATPDEARKMVEELRSNLEEMKEAKLLIENNWPEGNAMDEFATMEYLQAEHLGIISMLEASLDRYEATGEWSVDWSAVGGANGGPAANEDEWTNWAGDIQPGWNGQDFDLRNREGWYPPESGYNDAKIEEIFGNKENFKGFVYYNDDLAFLGNEGTTEIKGWMVGKDAAIVHTYVDAEGAPHEEYFIVRDFATKVEHKILFSVHNSLQEANILMSPTYRISDGSGGVYVDETGETVPYKLGDRGWLGLIGNDKKNRLEGALGARNWQAGLGDKDELIGGAYADSQWGDDWDGMQRAALGLEPLSQDVDHDDTIDGRLGGDVQDGGFGYNIGDDPSQNNIDDPLPTVNVTPQARQWLGDDSVGWSEEGIREIRDGEIEIRETEIGPDNRLVIQMPEEYENAFFSRSGEGDLVITMVSGNKTFKITVLRFFLDTNEGLDSAKVLEFIGNRKKNFIDALNGELDFLNNNLIIKGGGGDDMIIAPKNALVQDGMSFIDLSTGRYGSERSAEDFKDNVIPEGIEPEEDEDGEIHNPLDVSRAGKEVVVERSEGGAGPQFVRVDPAEYDHGYVYEVDGENGKKDLILVLVKQGVDHPETMTIRFKDWHQFQATNEDENQITKDLSWLIVSRDAAFGDVRRGLHGGSDAIQAHNITLHYLRSDTGGSGYPPGTYISGGDGEAGAPEADNDKDLVFHAKGDIISRDVETDVEVDMRHYDPSKPPSAVNPNDPPAPNPDPAVDPDDDGDDEGDEEGGGAPPADEA